MADEIDPKHEPSLTLQAWMEVLNELRKDKNWKDDPRLFSLWEGIANLAFGHPVKDVPEIVPANPAGHSIKDLRGQHIRDRVGHAVNKMVKAGKSLNEASVYALETLSPVSAQMKESYGITVVNHKTVQGWSYGYKDINKETRDKHLIDRIASINVMELESRNMTGEEMIDELALSLEEW